MRPAAVPLLVVVLLLGAGPASAEFIPLISLISASPEGDPGDHLSLGPSVDRRGEHVAFVTIAGNLVDSPPADCGNASRGLVAACSRVVVWTRGGGLEALHGADGNPPNENTLTPVLSSTGSHVVFTARATNLVHDDDNGIKDVFIWSPQDGTTRRVNLADDGSAAEDPAAPGGLSGGRCATFCGTPSVSASGRFVMFDSWSSNLVEEDDNARPDMFVRDMSSNRTLLASVSRSGGVADDASYRLWGGRSMSDDGSTLAFTSTATDLVTEAVPQCPHVTDSWPIEVKACPQVYVRDLRANVTRLVSESEAGVPGDSMSWMPQISADGRHVAFLTQAENLLPVDTRGAAQLVSKDLSSGNISLLSVDAEGRPADSPILHYTFSGDARSAAFITAAGNLDPQNTTEHADVYLRDATTKETRMVSWGLDGKPFNAPAHSLALSGDGRWLALATDATNVMRGVDSGLHQVYLLDTSVVDPAPPAAQASGFVGPLLVVLFLGEFLRRRR